MNELQIFENNELCLRARAIRNLDGSISINAEDTARGFGWITVAKSGNEVVRWARMNDYCKEFGFSLQVGKDDYIPEPLFYRLGMKANNAVADKFQNWLSMDVIPSIRKNGGYILGQETMSDDELLAAALLVAQNKIIEKNKTIKHLETEVNVKNQVIGELKPKADYTDRILKNLGLVTTTQIAKDYGMSAYEMNNKLHELKIQFKQSGQWLLYKEYHGMGYTHSETIDITRSSGMADVKMNTKWTQEGRLFLYEKLKSDGVIPTIEMNCRRVS